jgi:tetratricopeptide (TPR) repeat protein
LSGIFEWGFSEMLISLGHINDSLVELLKITKTPAQTWAYEQFEMARDEFRRGLYSESLESVTKAISGYGSNPGYKTEFRFHFLQGTILLGSFKNSDPKIVDPAEAEAAFLLAARYASSDFPKEAASSLLCAGRAAFTQGKCDVAIQHTKNAIALDGRLVEAYYQAAQVQCALGRPAEASENLVTAICYDHNYSIKAASDGDIGSYPEMLKEALVSAKNKLQMVFEEELGKFTATTSQLRSAAIDKYAVSSLCVEELSAISHYEKGFRDEAEKNNIFGYVQATHLVREGKGLLRKVVSSFQQASGKIISDEQGGLNRAIADIDSEMSKSEPMQYNKINLVLTAISLSIALFLFTPLSAWNIFSLIAGIVITIFIICVLVRSIRKMFFWKSKANQANSQKQQLQEKISELQSIKNQVSAFNVQID